MADPEQDELDQLDAAELLVIVLALDESDPTAYDTTRGLGIRCVLCDAEPPGMSAVLIQDWHREYCPWRRAREYAEQMRRDATGDDDGG